MQACTKGGGGEVRCNACYVAKEKQSHLWHNRWQLPRNSEASDAARHRETSGGPRSSAQAASALLCQAPGEVSAVAEATEFLVVGGLAE